MSKQRVLESLRTGGLIVAALSFVALPTAAQGPLTANDVFAEIGTRVPEFGGMFVNEEKDTLYVFLVPGGKSSAAELDKVITDVLGSARPAQTHRIVLLEGQYSFVQLKEWHDGMSAPVLAIPGTVLTGIDQRTNRLQVGVSTLALEPDVAAKLAELGVPREAVNVKEVPRADHKTRSGPIEPPVAGFQGPSNTIAPRAANFQDPMSDAITCEHPCTLESKIRPLVGGIRISFESKSENNKLLVCTLGFVAEREKVTGFVTNSHCTDIRGGVQNTVFFQPTPPEGIGVETVDPCYSDPSGPAPSFPRRCRPVPDLLKECPKGEACRYSDSAFAKAFGDIQTMIGFIARPTKEGSTDWDPPDTFFEIIGEQQFQFNVVIPGQSVSYVGATSGFQKGELTFTCDDENGTKPYTYICQGQFKGKADFGDSGSPVFVCLDKHSLPAECPGSIVVNNVIKVRLVGILWGGDEKGTEGDYSPIGVMDGTGFGVQNRTNELGPLKACAEGDC